MIDLHGGRPQSVSRRSAVCMRLIVCDCPAENHISITGLEPPDHSSITGFSQPINYTSITGFSTAYHISIKDCWAPDHTSITNFRPPDHTSITNFGYRTTFRSQNLCAHRPRIIFGSQIQSPGKSQIPPPSQKKILQN